MSWPLYGRRPELDWLTGLLDDTAAGAGGAHLLTGAPGIGKSRLLQEAMSLAADRAIAVASREAFRLDQVAPLVTLAGALRDCTPEAEAFGWLARHEPERSDPLGALHRLRASLEEAARERPLLIVIDDAQWMDELSALAIRELIPALASSPVRWLLAHRPATDGGPDSPGHQLSDWLRREGVRPTVLGALDTRAVTELCVDVVGAEVDNTVVALAASCGGNPLRTEQLLKALLATGQLVVADGVGSVTGNDLPSSFVDSVRELLDAQSDGTRWLLKQASIFGRPFTIEEVARLGGKRPAELLPVIGEAMTDFLVEDTLGGLAFAHDLVRQAVYSTLARSVREQLHREVVAITRDAGRPALEVAEHQLKSGRSGAGEAARMVRSLAREIAPFAPGAAADAMLRVLAAGTPGGPGRADLVADTVPMLAAAGRLDEARKLGCHALEVGLEPQAEVRLLHGLAEACKHAGLNEMTVSYADQALAHDRVPPDVQARLYAVRAHALCYLGDLPGADESGRRADILGRHGGEAGAAVFGLAGRSLVAYTQGRLHDSLAHARTATALADEAGGEATLRHPRIWLGAALITLDCFDEAEREIRAGRRESERSGSAWADPLWHHFQSTLLHARGKIEEAAVEAESGLAVAGQLGANALAMPLLGMLLRLAVLRGDLAGAAEHLAHVRRLADDGVTAVPEDVLWPEAVLLDATGDPVAAFAVLRDIYAGLPDRPALLAGDPSAAAGLVRIATAAGQPDAAVAVVTAAARLAAGNEGSHAAAGAAAHADGVHRGDPARLLAAADEGRQAGRPLARAAALIDAAVAGRGTAEEKEVRSWLEEALPLAAGRVREKVLDLIDGSAPSDAASPSFLPQLTPTERIVARHVGDGRTNIEIAKLMFISRHTVDAHLRHIFAKLKIRRRVELAALVAKESG